METTNPKIQDPKRLEPSVRIKRLVEMSHDISVDKNIDIAKYFHSGRELIKSASSFEEKGYIEKSFVLYIRYMTLFLEKLIHHPQYNKADKNEKQLVKNECNRVFELAENLKRKILKMYEDEYKQSTASQTGSESTLHKRSIEPNKSSPKSCDIDEIDRKFDFNSGPKEASPTFDPFNIEQLERTLKSSRS